MQQYLMDTEKSHGIDSVQNGILLNVSLHYQWDNWGLSMYRIGQVSYPFGLCLP